MSFATGERRLSELAAMVMVGRSEGPKERIMATESCDVLFKGGTVIDGTGGPRARADVAVEGDRIVAVGVLDGMKAARTIDATGRIVSPGFIDAHTHDDNLLLVDRDMTPKTSQGVTTVIAGNCGVSLAPLTLKGAVPPPLDLLGGLDDFRYPKFADYVAALDETPPAANAGLLVGHSALRLDTMDDVDRPANAGEIDAMRERLAEGMEAGALGFSTGLIYAPNKAATTDEVAAVAEVAGAAGGLYVTHMRNEHDGVEESLEETFEIGRRAGAGVVISHHKCAGKANFGRSKDTLARIDKARKTQSVGLDVYPYTAGSTVMLPDMVRKAERVIVTWSEPHPEYSGRDLADVAREMGLDPVDAAEKLRPGGGIYFMMDEADVQRIIAYGHSMIGSDGLPHDKHPHPRLWGTFPRVLGHYARDLGLLTLEDAVRCMTGLTAHEFGLTDRGEVRVGAFADLVMFDPDTIIDTATFEAPKTPAAGIDVVMVNGAVIRENGAMTGARPGRALRRG
jgi:N-acyl-D-amino-acid deacylase